MEAHWEDGMLLAGGDARQRLYDARGYGRPLSDNRVALDRVEAAHLLMRGDLEAVDGAGFRAFFESIDEPGFSRRFLVYADLRERGFYLSPAREGWIQEPPTEVDFVVYPRGKGPADDTIEYRIRVLEERASVPASELGDRVLAVVDEESEVTYFRTTRPTIEGTTSMNLPDAVPCTLLDDRAICWTPPEALHESAFYGQPLTSTVGEHDAVQLSLVETAQLVATGTLDVSGGYDSVIERGRAVEGSRFDRRLQTYAALRKRGIVPKTGFKFGADFRTYSEVTSVSDLGHSERLVRVLPRGYEFLPRDISLDVRLAHGVRKRMTFAWPADGDVTFLDVERITP
jgi:tRNA-intron endonuclease